MRVFKNFKQLPQFKNAIITIGTFDGVHLGHQKILKHIHNVALKTNGESILITFHPHPRFILEPENKSLKLLNTLHEKIKLLETYELDNLIVVPFSKTFSNLPPLAYIEQFLVQKFNPHTIVIGYDHHFGINRSGNFKLLEEYKSTYKYNLVEISEKTIKDNKISSTKIRAALSNGNIEIATKLLGHSYSIRGFVVKGDQIGRKIGFPTANIKNPIAYKLIPKTGVYAVFCYINNIAYKGMLNIGYRPTVEGTNKKIEVHIFNFETEIYGEELEIVFKKFLRKEKKFDSLDELKIQLNEDKNLALKHLK